ncbi:MAG TPA: HEAT repeat domain-containing protein, partial [Phycisphaerae bacterium]|nr:HEAT repeat domain-containing protein [Phycisphaerae bacterium]
MMRAVAERCCLAWLFLAMASAAAVAADPGGASSTAPAESSPAVTRPAESRPATTQAATTRPAATRPLKRSQTPEAIERFVTYYLDLYGKQLQSSDGLARTMALISLARIDDPRVSEKLVEVMRHDKVPIVRVYAWEALHARQDQLSAEQRAAWVEAGFELAGKNFLWGDLRVGLVGVMAVGGPTPRNKRMLEHLFLNSNSLYPGDIRMLEAMGDLLAEWKSPDIIKGLIRSMEDIDRACRAELILRRVNGDTPHSTTLH